MFWTFESVLKSVSNIKNSKTEILKYGAKKCVLMSFNIVYT